MTRHWRTESLIPILVAFICVAWACAPKVPPELQVKADAAYTVSDIQTGLHTAYTAELTAYTTHLSPTLTDTEQIKILGSFAHAFDDVAAATVLVKAMKPGDPIPTMLATVLSDEQTIQTAVSQLHDDTKLGDVLGKIQKAITATQGFINQLKALIKVPAGVLHVA